MSKLRTCYLNNNSGKITYLDISCSFCSLGMQYHWQRQTVSKCYLDGFLLKSNPVYLSGFLYMRIESTVSNTVLSIYHNTSVLYGLRANFKPKSLEGRGCDTWVAAGAPAGSGAGTCPWQRRAGWRGPAPALVSLRCLLEHAVLLHALELVQLRCTADCSGLCIGSKGLEEGKCTVLSLSPPCKANKNPSLSGFLC